VTAIHVAVANTPALHSAQHEYPIDCCQDFEFYDWVELRDFFGIDGRLIQGDERTFIPYWENLSEWASIPLEHEQCAAALCKEYHNKLKKLLDKNGHNTERIGKHIKYLAR